MPRNIFKSFAHSCALTRLNQIHQQTTYVTSIGKKKKLGIVFTGVDRFLLGEFVKKKKNKSTRENGTLDTMGYTSTGIFISYLKSCEIFFL